jgi:hypothetical protein
MFILQFLVDHFVKFKFLDGYKMYGVGASMVFAGLGTLAHSIAVGGFVPFDDANMNAYKLLASGMAVIGAAGKADGLIKATNANTAVAQVNATANAASAGVLVQTAEERK